MDACKINGIDIMSREDVENLPISDVAKANLMIIFEAQGCFNRKQGSVERAITYFERKRLEAALKKSAENKQLKLTFDEAISHKSLAEIKEDRKAALKVVRNAVKYESARQSLEQPKIKLTFEEGASGKSIAEIKEDREAALKRSRKRRRPESFLFGQR